MTKMKHTFTVLSLLTTLLWSSCSGSSDKATDGQTFYLGADMGWITMLEAQGQEYYNFDGEQRDPFALLPELGLNAVRLRVWVDPSKYGNWCDLEDNIQKAHRAKEQGLDIMVDFHYSDWWADPAKQNIPAAWFDHDYETMKQDLREHTLTVLRRFKDEGLEPRWVQVGNETSNGMLWSVATDPETGWEIKDEQGRTTITHSMGHLERNPEQYAGFFKAGAEAVKEVFPEAKVIVHLDNGYDKDLYNRNLDVLKAGGCEWDIVGMSLYPYWAHQSDTTLTAQIVIDRCMENINLVSQKYNCDVMITETGFEVDEQYPELMDEGRDQLSQIIRRCKNETNGRCKGVFYWEPLCRPSQYRLGAFTEDGHPTAIMQAFKL